MLVIRPQQMSALLEPETRRFAVQLAALLGEQFPDRFPDAAAANTTSFVERAMAAALAHGLSERGQVTSLARLRAAYGERFEWTPVAARAWALLEDDTLPGAIKMAALEALLFDATGGRPVQVVPDTMVAGEEG